ncbi:NisI/SpaI family lantibiotic immunity lipoprotein, partial [Streptococcus agalactiae]|nr:NisI/SpaI family lantibiotic immunity lipoprotein [Streptococcus agalactiae]
FTKEDLDKIDWLGENKSKRQKWFYLDVYKISGVNIDDGFAVKVNDQYLKAKSE